MAGVASDTYQANRRPMQRVPETRWVFYKPPNTPQVFNSDHERVNCFVLTSLLKATTLSNP